LRTRARRFLTGVLAAGVAFLPAAAMAESTKVPITASDRKTELLPAGEKIELSLQKTISLALSNALDLNVASYTYDKASFSFAGSRGIFDPNFELDLTASGSESPVVATYLPSDTKTQSANAFLTGLLPWGTSYKAGWTNSRSDAPSSYTTINPSLTSTFAGSVTQPLLRNFGRDVTERLIVQARIARDQSAWSFVVSVQTAVQTVENAYWDLLYALENLKAKQEALDRAKDFNRITKIKIDVGALAPIEIVQTEVTIAQREQDIILAEGQIGDAQDKLKRILNVKGKVEWDRPIVPTDPPRVDRIELDVDKGIQTALSLRPEVKQAVVDIDSKKISLVYNRNQLRPRLDLAASYGLSGLGGQKAALSSCTISGVSVDNCAAAGGQVITTPLNLNYSDALYQIRDRDFPSWTVGLVFSVPIGNRTAKANAAMAATDLELSRTNLALLLQNLQLEVRAAARAVDTAYRSVLAARKSRELAERNLDAEEKKFQNGMTTSFQVAQIQNDLTSARSNELQAITGHLKAIAAWHKSTGDLLPWKDISLAGLPVTTGATAAEEGGVK
jgi:outer membrane protein TolC